MIPERVIILVFQQPLTILRIAVALTTSIVGGEFGTVVRRNERLVGSSLLQTGRRSWGRGEANVLLLLEVPERILVSRAEGIGRVQKLFVVGENKEDEEGSDNDFNDEGENVRPRGSIPGIVTPCAHERDSMGNHDPSFKGLTVCSFSWAQRGATDGTPDSPALQCRPDQLLFSFVADAGSPYIEKGISSGFAGTHTQKGFLKMRTR